MPLLYFAIVLYLCSDSGIPNALRKYHAVESGTLRLELSVIPIFDLIQRTVAEFHHQAQQKNISLQLEFGSFVKDNEQSTQAVLSAEELPEKVMNRKVVGDVSRLGQVLRYVASC